MKLKERIKHFWNVTLGVDCPEEKNILDSQRPEDEELKESLARIIDFEKKYKAFSASSSKGGKGNSGKSIVEPIKIDDFKAMKEAKQKAAESKGKNVEENQI